MSSIPLEHAQLHTGPGRQPATRPHFGTGKTGEVTAPSVLAPIIAPTLTALRATTAEAIVIDTVASVVLGSPGPHSGPRARTRRSRAR